MNYWAVLLVAVSSFMLGGLWYSAALIGRTWTIENCSQKQAGYLGSCCSA